MRAESYLKEDVGRGDITTELVVPDTDGMADIVCEQDAVIAGIEVVTELLESVGVATTANVSDGDRVRAGMRVMSLSGSLAAIITAERTVLNILMRMSGVATATAAAVERAEGKLVIAATRKVTPGFGELEKEAVRIAGGDPHRACLDSMIMIKDNHIKACGSVRACMERLSGAPLAYKVEVEVESVEDAVTAAEMGADIIMADNCGPELTGEIRDAVRAVNDRILVEASGGIGVDDVPGYIGRADIVSLGCITHSSGSVMYRLDINRRPFPSGLPGLHQP